MIDFLWAYRGPLGVALVWAWSRLRNAMPALGTPRFYRVWLYDFVKGNSAAKQPPA